MVAVPRLIGMTTFTFAASDAVALAKSRAHKICTGTDDQDLINNAMEISGRVRLTAGTFSVGDSIILTDKSRLSGEGLATRILADTAFATDATATATIIGVGSPYRAMMMTTPTASPHTTGIIVEDIWLDGNSANQPTQAASMVGLLLKNTGYGQIRNVTATDVLRTGYITDNTKRQMGILMTECEYLDLFGCDCLRAGYEAMGIREQAYHITVHGGLCVADDNANHACQTTANTEANLPSHIKFIGTRFRRDNFTSLYGGFISHYARDIQLTGCSFDDCGCTFSYLAGRGIINGCDFFNARANIYLYQCNDVIVANNRINVGGNAVVCDSDCTNLRFRGNQIKSNYRTLSILTETLSGLLIEGNTLEAGTDAIYISGVCTSPRIRDNVVLGKPDYVFRLVGENITNALIEGNVVPALVDNAIFLSEPVAGTIVRNNIGHTQVVTRNSGTATVANGATYVDVTHGLRTTPAAKDIFVTATNSMGNAVKFWISDLGASTFRINVDADPGATTAIFSWQASCNGG